jgi:hypothetical protein
MTSPYLDSSSASDLSALLAEHAGSPLSLAAFARERGVPAWRLYEARRRARGADHSCADSPLVPVRVLPLAGTDSAELHAPAAIDVELVSGRKLRIPSGFDAETLARIVGVLDRC